jgi:hypothetical protein
MFDRLSNSWALARSSWRVLMQNKALLIFPLLSSLCCLLVLASFLAPLLVNLREDATGELYVNLPNWAMFALAFGFYFFSYFFIVFFNAALVSCALISFSGQKPTVGDGLRAASARMPQITAWAFVSATVGMILKAIENAHEKAGEIISAILGTAWTVMTYFVVPVLVVEKVGPFAAIGRSVSILKKTWGESLVGNFGIGLVVFLLCLPGMVVVALGVALAGKSVVMGLAVVALALIYLLGVSAVGSALQGIFLSAVYQYAAHGEVPGEFERQTVEHAFTTKPA